jgi:hypothetical protein
MKKDIWFLDSLCHNHMTWNLKIFYSLDESQNPGSMLIACNISQENEKDIWFLDSVCHNHMKGNLKIFYSLDESVK